jgi:hypothetical protein
VANIKNTPLDLALMPAVRALQRLAPAQVKDCQLKEQTEYADRVKYLYLDVRHVICTVDIYAPADGRRNWMEMDKRIRAALLIKEPSVKARKVERRLMLARGEQARKSKARKS